MHALTAMMKKDWRIIRLSFWGILGSFLAFYVLLGTNVITTQDNVKLTLSLLPVSFHFLYIPTMFWYSLQVEARRLQQWLHSPSPAWKLTLSKLVVTLFAFIVSLLITSIYPVWKIFHLIESTNNVAWIVEKVGLVTSYVAIGLLSFTSLILLFWSLFHWVRRFTGKWAWLINCLSFGLYIWAWGYFSTTKIYARLVEWGEMVQSNQITNSSGDLITIGGGSIFIGEMVFQLLLLSIQVLLACWIIDRKMEV